MDLTVRVGYELDAIRVQVDRMAEAHTSKKLLADFNAAWFSAREHITELAKILAEQK